MSNHEEPPTPPQSTAPPPATPPTPPPTRLHRLFHWLWYGPPSTTDQTARCAKTFHSLSAFTGAMVLVVVVLIALAVAWDLPVIRRLSDPAFARGLITFLISVSTIGLAFILVFSSFTETDDPHFRRAREIFAGLMGVLGTIVGFYFGSTEKPTAPLEVTAIEVIDNRLLTHISGGAPPYTYLITSTDKSFQEIKKVSDDGWIAEVLAQPLKPGTTITVKVIDNRDQKTTRKYDVPAEGKPGAPPTPQAPNAASPGPPSTGPVPPDASPSGTRPPR